MFTLIAANQCPNCDADLSELRRLTQPPTFCLQCRFPIILIAGKYRLIRILGEGGFGTVYLAEHIRLKRNAERVVKIIKQDIFARDGMEDRFYREVQVTSDLSQRNEHIVRVYDDFGDVPMLGHFYVMEYLEGEPLTQYMLDAKNVPPIAWTIDIFGQLCDAMQAAHEEHIIHRDLKPDNILLIKRRKNPYFVKVLDFGIAKPIQGSGQTDLNLTQGALGTPMYMPPEQATNKPIDGRSDLYAMGIMLFELLTGHHPFIPIGRENHITSLELLTAQLMQQPPSLRALRPDLDIPVDLEQVVLKTLAKLPEERYQTVDEFWEALSQTSPSQTRGPVIAATHMGEPPSPIPTPHPSRNPEALRTTFSPEHYSTPPSGEQLVIGGDGAPILSYEEAPDTTPPELKTNNWQAKQKNKTWLWLVLILLLVTGGGLYAAGFFSSPAKESPRPRKRVLVLGKPRTAIQPRVPNEPVPAQQQVDAGNSTNDDHDNGALEPAQRVAARTKTKRRRRRRSHRLTRRRKKVVYIPPRPVVRVVPKQPVAPSNGCKPGEVRLRVRSCKQGGGRFVITIGDKEKRYRTHHTICVPQKAGELGVEQPACRECIIQLRTTRPTMYLYLKDQNDKNRKLSLNYCRKR